MKILVLNAGSSSQKSCLYNLNPASNPEQPPAPLWEASIDWTVRRTGILPVNKDLPVNKEYGLLKVEANGQKVKINLQIGRAHV